MSKPVIKPSGPRVRRERGKGHVREDILAAGARAFSRRGYDATTMQEVAREAGYSAASLYEYFPSKQAIFEGILDGLTEKLLATYDDLPLRGVTFAQRLELLIRRQLELLDEHRDACTVFFTARSSADFVAKKGQKPRAPGYSLNVERFARWLKDHAGDQLSVSIDDAAHALAGISYAFFLRWLAQGERLADRTPTIVDLFLDGALKKS